ncbi:MAG: M14 family metallopeptidase [bacterium]|nr:M14 family metallopeptidase [bacterium]
MQSFFSTRIIAAILTVAVLGGGVFLWLNRVDKQSVEPAATYDLKDVLIGKSVQGREIRAYTYGSGATHLLFVGGMHGGYEWNSVLLAYQFLDYLKANPDFISKDLRVTIIPDLNPDGVYRVIPGRTGGMEGRFTINDVPKGDLSSGRFNAHHVDLNRNFDCKWKPESMWQGKTVSAGTAAFSEPEAAALRHFVLTHTPSAAVFWHSQANAVYASECKDGILSETLAIMNAYAKAANYPAVKSFDAYAISGDAEGWLASINIPAITVELSTHETVEWDKNLAGIKALFEYYDTEL